MYLFSKKVDVKEMGSLYKMMRKFLKIPQYEGANYNSALRNLFLQIFVRSEILPVIEVDVGCAPTEAFECLHFSHHKLASY